MVSFGWRLVLLLAKESTETVSVDAWSNNCSLAWVSSNVLGNGYCVCLASTGQSINWMKI